MPIEDACPECGGVEHRLISPGLAECTSTIRWTEIEQQVSYETVDDPGAFYNLGLRGTKQVAVTRNVEVEHSRICGHRFELEVGMSTVACVSGPDGKCGAFAVGHCADCSNPACRFHGQFFDGRLLCDICRVAIENQRALEAAEAAKIAATEAEKRRQQAAEHARIESEKQAAAQASAKATYDALPVYSDADWIEILNGGTEPPGKRPTAITKLDAVRLINASGKRSRRIAVKRWTFLNLHGYLTTAGWVVGRTTHQVTIRGENVTETVWVVLTSDGTTHFGSPYKRKIHVYAKGGPGWTPSTEAFKRARPFLDRRPLHFKDAP
ncbi:MAG: hypothetical protein NTV23_13980 [Propionibacteriales bacterium]|nr:hypothetical protein [Propionibacteriales bacterium]